MHALAHLLVPVLHAAGDLHEHRHLPLGFLPEAELAVVVHPPRVERALVRHRQGVVPARGHLDHLAVRQGGDHLRQHAVHVVAHTELVVPVVAPPVHLPARRHGEGVVLPRGHLHHALLLKVRDELGGVLVLVVAHPQLPVEVTPPRVDAPVHRHREHVSVADRHLGDRGVDVDALRHLHRARAEVPLAQLARVVEPPRVYRPIIGDGGGGELAACDLHHLDLGEPRVLLGDGVAVLHLADAQLPKGVPAPREELARGHDHRGVALVLVRVPARGHPDDGVRLLRGHDELRGGLCDLGGMDPELPGVVAAPPEHLPPAQEDEHARGARGHVLDFLPVEEGDEAGRRARGEVALPELPEGVSSPRVKLAAEGDADGVGAAAHHAAEGDLRGDLRGDVTEPILAHAQLRPGVVTESEERALVRDGHGVRVPQGERGKLGAPGDRGRGGVVLGATLAHAQLPERVFAPPDEGAVLSEGKVVVPARHNQLEAPPGGNLHLHGARARLLVAHPELPIGVVAPRIHRPGRGPHDRVPCPRRDPRDLDVLGELHLLGRAELRHGGVVVPELVARVRPPGKHLTLMGDRHRVRLACIHAHHVVAEEPRDRDEDVAVRVVAQAKLAIRVIPRGVQLPGRREGQGVTIHLVAPSHRNRRDVLAL
mmetsp:Transcript_28606/g.91209  ORF Transcript_28606/g.91209 Transcript_28606/m.91209 type:complete len:654 (+) Transcript_28606:450-2411(+)